MTLHHAMLTLAALDWSQALSPFTSRWWQETVCSMLVGTACGVLGCFVVLRRMALIGDALAHAVLPGVVIAFMLHTQMNPAATEVGVTALLLGALIAGLTTAVLINVVSRHSRTKEDSAVGIVFTALFALGIILISALPRGTHFDLKCFLWGDPLAVGRSDLILMAIIAPLVILVVAVMYQRLRLVSFDPVVAAAMGVPVLLYHYLLMGMLSATVVAGLKTTGVILVVAMVITPASAAYQLCNRLWPMLVLSGLFGALSAALGMSVAFATNSPTGPAMVLVATVIFVLSVLLSPSHGIVFDRIRRWRMIRHIEAEDILKAAYHLAPAGAFTEAGLSRSTRLPLTKVRTLVQELVSRNLLAGDGDGLKLTTQGSQRATEMVRSHRLWESYLAQQAGLPGEQVHEHAEVLEHAHELADEVDATLGHPKLDPHGEVIPPPVKPA